MLEHLGYGVRLRLRVSKHCKPFQKNFPILFYTGYLDEPSAGWVRAARIVAIAKPATLKELGDAVREALGQWAKMKNEP